MKLIWSIKDLVEISKTRQNNKFDVIIAVSGSRGNGKSTLLYKFFSRFKNFKPWSNLVYSRKDVMKLLEDSQYGCIFDDEAIRTGYKRNFYDQDQKLLIQMVNMYRDNFNIYGLAVPNFYSLDKDLRDLVKIHIHILERGFAVFHLPNEDSLYSDDIWDVKYNKKIEERWAKHKQKHVNFSPPYHKLTTFRGYIHFGDLSPKQRLLYEEIKKIKRKAVYELEMKKEDNKEDHFYQNVMERLKEGMLSKQTLQEICLVNGMKYSYVRDQLNKKFSDLGMTKRVGDLLILQTGPIHNKSKLHINQNMEKLPVI